jgi:hypothetical protein
MTAASSPDLDLLARGRRITPATPSEMTSLVAIRSGNRAHSEDHAERLLAGSRW